MELTAVDMARFFKGIRGKNNCGLRPIRSKGGDTIDGQVAAIVSPVGDHSPVTDQGIDGTHKTVSVITCNSCLQDFGMEHFIAVYCSVAGMEL
uniref:Uncharacterized protein n=1 Tax=Magallana gigas TaxID=29159 RepID=K1QRT3_MAGGI